MLSHTAAFMHKCSGEWDNVRAYSNACRAASGHVMAGQALGSTNSLLLSFCNKQLCESECNQVTPKWFLVCSTSEGSAVQLQRLLVLGRVRNIAKSSLT